MTRDVDHVSATCLKYFEITAGPVKKKKNNRQQENKTKKSRETCDTRKRRHHHHYRLSQCPARRGLRAAANPGAVLHAGWIRLSQGPEPRPTLPGERGQTSRSVHIGQREIDSDSYGYTKHSPLTPAPSGSPRPVRCRPRSNGILKSSWKESRPPHHDKTGHSRSQTM